MKKTIRLASVVLTTFVLLAVAHSEERYTIQVTVKDSAAEQIALARSLASDVRLAVTETDRGTAIAKAIETLEVIPRLWPNERAHLVNGAILEADLFMMSDAPRDALRVLQRTELIAKNGRGAALIHLRMGRAYVRLRDYVRAESTLLQAEREAPPEGSETVFAVRLDLANVLSRDNRSIEAAARYRELAKDPALDPTNQATFLMWSAREHLRGGDKVSGRSDLDGVDRILAGAKGLRRTGDEVRIQEDLERETKTLRSKHGL